MPSSLNAANLFASAVAQPRPAARDKAQGESVDAFARALDRAAPAEARVDRREARRPPERAEAPDRPERPETAQGHAHAYGHDKAREPHGVARGRNPEPGTPRGPVDPKAETPVDAPETTDPVPAEATGDSIEVGTEVAPAPVPQAGADTVEVAPTPVTTAATAAEGEAEAEKAAADQAEGARSAEVRAEVAARLKNETAAAAVARGGQPSPTAEVAPDAADVAATEDRPVLPTLAETEAGTETPAAGTPGRSAEVHAAIEAAKAARDEARAAGEKGGVSAAVGKALNAKDRDAAEAVAATAAEESLSRSRHARLAEGDAAATPDTIPNAEATGNGAPAAPTPGAGVQTAASTGPAAASALASKLAETDAPPADEGADPVVGREGRGAETGQIARGDLQGQTKAAQPRVALESVVQTFAQVLKSQVGRSTRFDLQLDPAELGAVDVRIDIDRDGKLKAQLAFDNPLAAADLRARADDLRRQLEQAGFQIAPEDLSFTDRDPSQGGFGQALADERQAASRLGARAFAGAGEIAARADVVPVYRKAVAVGGVDLTV